MKVFKLTLILAFLSFAGYAQVWNTTTTTTQTRIVSGSPQIRWLWNSMYVYSVQDTIAKYAGHIYTGTSGVSVTGTVIKSDTVVMRTAANSLTLAQTQTALNLKANLAGNNTFTGTTNTFNNIQGTQLTVAGLGGAGFLNMAGQTARPSTPGGSMILYASDGTGYKFNFLTPSNHLGTLDFSTLSADRIDTIGNGSGTVALLPRATGSTTDSVLTIVNNVIKKVAQSSISGSGITALTGAVIGSGTGSVATTLASNIVANANIVNGTINLTTKVNGRLPVANVDTTNSNGVAPEVQLQQLYTRTRKLNDTTLVFDTKDGVRKDTIVFNGAAGNTSNIIYPTKLSRIPTQRLFLSPGWTTVSQVSSGTGVITSMTIDFFGNGSLTDASTCKMRISVNGESTPSLFGTAGATMGQWFDFGNGQYPVFMASNVGVSANTVTTNNGIFGAFTKLLIPYTNGFKIEIYNPAGSGTIETWTQVDHTDDLSVFPYDPAYVLKGVVTSGSVASLAEQSFIDVSGDVILYGWHHNLSATSGTGVPGPWEGHMEGDYRIYYNSESTASFQANGSEDMYDSSYNFQSTGIYQLPYRGVTYLNNTSCLFGGYAYFIPKQAPRGSSHLKVTWQNGDPTYHVPANAAASEATVFYYVK